MQWRPVRLLHAMTIHPINQNKPNQYLTGSSWQERLDAAHLPQDVVATARDFLALFTPYELFAIPESCRPAANVHEDEIADLAYQLVQCEATIEGEAAELVHKLARFFSHAATRLGQLHAHDHEYDDDGRQSA